MLFEQNGKTREEYVDNMLVKSIKAAEHLTHLEEMFKILMRQEMMLNLAK